MRPPPPPKLLSDGGAPSETEEGTAKRKRGKDTYYDKSEDFEKLAAKDELTLMLRQLHPKTGEFDVFKLFSKAGKVTDVRLITDERTGKCLGAGYIEMADGGSFSRALQLDGSLIREMPIIVQPSYAEKNRLAAKGATPAAIKAAGMMAGATLGMGSGVESGMKLCVGNLHSEITEEQLRGVFSPFGSPKRKKAARRKPRDGRRRRCPARRLLGADRHPPRASDGRGAVRLPPLRPRCGREAVHGPDGPDGLGAF